MRWAAERNKNSVFLTVWNAWMLTYFENIVSKVLLETSGNTLPTHKAVRPSGLRGLETTMGDTTMDTQATIFEWYCSPGCFIHDGCKYTAESMELIVFWTSKLYIEVVYYCEQQETITYSSLISEPCVAVAVVIDDDCGGWDAGVSAIWVGVDDDVWGVWLTVL